MGHVVAVLVGLALVVMPAASLPAHADEAEDRAAAEIAAERCAAMRAADEVPRQYKEDCETKLGEDLRSGRAGSPDWTENLCRWVPDLPLVGNPCQRLIEFMSGVYEDYQARVDALRGAAEAITNPVDTALKNFSETVANALRSLLDEVFVELVHISSPNLASQGFLSTYAAGAGIGMFVLVIMIARVWYRAATGDVTGEQLAESMWRWVPTAMVLVLFGPGIGYLLVRLTDAASLSIVDYFAPDVLSLATKVQTMVVLTEVANLPGGALMALGVMGVAFLGVIGLVGGLLMQLLALYLTGSIMAVAFTMLIDPASRDKALRLPLMWVGIAAARPVLFFLLGAIGRMADSAFTTDAIQDDGLRALVTAFVAALALLIVGVAPWSLLRFAPVLPAGAGSGMARSSRSSSGGAVGNLAHTMMMQMSYRRLQGSAASSGGGPPGPGPGEGSPDAGVPERQPAPDHSSSSSSSAAARTPHPDPAATPGSGGVPAGAGVPASVGSGPGGGAAAASGAAGAGGPAAGGAAAAGAGAGTAAAAGATAATGGLAAAALIGVQVADVAKRKAEDTAHRATDVTDRE